MTCRCPECGFAYDEQTTVFYASGNHVIVGVLGGYMGALPACVFILPRILAENGQRTLAFALPLAYFSGLVIQLRYVMRKKQRGVFVAATADGLLTSLIGQPKKEIPWENISAVRTKPSRRGKANLATLFLKKEQTTIDVEVDMPVFAKQSELEDFVEHCRVYIDRCRNSLTAAAPPQ